MRVHLRPSKDRLANRIRLGIVLALAALVATLFGTAGPAQASSGDGNCETSTYFGEFCVYEWYNFGYPMRDFLLSQGDYYLVHYVNNSTPLFQTISSAQNFDPYEQLRAYAGGNYTGHSVLFYAKYTPCTQVVCWRYGNLGTVDLDNVMASHLWI